MLFTNHLKYCISILLNWFFKIAAIDCVEGQKFPFRLSGTTVRQALKRKMSFLKWKEKEKEIEIFRPKSIFRPKHSTLWWYAHFYSVFGFFTIIHFNNASHSFEFDHFQICFLLYVFWFLRYNTVLVTLSAKLTCEKNDKLSLVKQTSKQILNKKNSFDEILLH